MQYVSIIHHYIGNRRQENNSLGRIGVPGQISRVVPAAAVSTALGWIVVRMAELLMKSAIVESDPMTSRELPHYWTLEQVRQILAAMDAGQPWLFARLTG